MRPRKANGVFTLLTPNWRHRNFFFLLSKIGKVDRNAILGVSNERLPLEAVTANPPAIQSPKLVHYDLTKGSRHLTALVLIVPERGKK